MTHEQIIRQLILDNMHKGVGKFELCWKWSILSYNYETNSDKSLKDMIDWFYSKIMELAKDD